MKKIKFVAVLTILLSSFLMTSCSTDDTPSNDGTSTDGFWPLAVNNQWNFNDNGTSTSTIKITGTTSFSGTTYYQLQEPNPYNLDFWVVKKGATYYLKVAKLTITENGTTITIPSYEAPVLKEDLAVNTSSSGTVNLSVTGTAGGQTINFPTTIKYTLTTLEKGGTLTINGTTYTDVLKSSQKQEETINGQTTIAESTTWYANNVGPIKSITKSDGITTESVIINYILNN
ncbi:hypothetical protein FFWV33_04160 [Flavobacterium faecale]|uniref:Lipocalin-like domain-containing protein n=1 Tax=Flavobacterium faecale TaxID=1355330 RepID=A0A2S1LAK2_9FLAO|nr:hypothetical protein [Flavobacterium faecale]AWG20790.1 hypothetical protein FFWV33_04160 [Flavobacterium faecale]